MATCKATDYLKSIPQELRQRKQWLVWGVDASNPKRPFSPKTLSSDAWRNPANWGTFDDAVQRVQNKQAKGLGFAFNGDGVVGIDLDNVFDDVMLIPEAIDIITRLDSFTEWSQSRNGLHAYVFAPGVNLGITKVSHDFPGYPKEAKRHIEFYQSTGYFAMTGKPYGDVRPMLNRAEQLRAVYDMFSNVAPVEPKKPVVPVHDGNNDDDLRYLEIGLQKDQTFLDMWNGKRPTGNESDDDLSFFNKLAYWLNNNAELMESQFYGSWFYSGKDDAHKKKCSRKDYIVRTIQKAISGTPTTARDRDAAFKREQARKDFTPVTPVTSVTSDAWEPPILFNNVTVPPFPTKCLPSALMCNNAGHKPAAVTLNVANIYEHILTANQALDDAQAPETQRLLVVTPAVYVLMKKSKDIIMETDIGNGLRLKGVIAHLDGAMVIKVPANRLPSEFGFLLAHPCATVAPVKLEDYKTHNDPPGISGSLVEGRINYDAFVLDNKVDALYYQEQK